MKGRLLRPIAIRLPTHMEYYFRRLAARNGLTFSSVIRFALEEEKKRMGKRVRVILKGKK